MGASTTSRNRRLALALGATVCGMVGLAYASVPLYQLFCQVTGYGGTTKVAEAVPGGVSQHEITVTFNAETNRDLPWAFQPLQGHLTLRAGESALYAMRPEFVRAGIGFTVVSGDMVDDTIVMRAAAIAQAATTAPSPGIVYVGRADYLTTA